MNLGFNKVDEIFAFTEKSITRDCWWIVLTADDLVALVLETGEYGVKQWHNLTMLIHLF